MSVSKRKNPIKVQISSGYVCFPFHSMLKLICKLLLVVSGWSQSKCNTLHVPTLSPASSGRGMISHGSVLSPARCFRFVLRVRSRCFARPAASVSRSFLRRYGENSPWVASFTSFWRLESTSGCSFPGRVPLSY